MHLTDRARLNTQVCCSDSLGDGKVCRISNADLTTSCVNGLLSQHLVGELDLGLLVSFALAWHLVVNGTRL